MVGELLAGRTNVNVLVSHIAEVLLAEASFGLCVRGHRLWQRNRDTSLVACANLFAVELTAVGDGIELLHAQRRLGLVGHMGELRSVSPVVGYLMHNDQMMVGLDGNLKVVADDAGTAAAGGHRAGIGIGQRYLLVRGGKHLHLETLETPHLLLQRLDLLFEAVRLGLQRL